MMMQRADTNIPTCRSCFWFCYERMAVDCYQRESHEFCGVLSRVADCCYALPGRDHRIGGIS